LALTYIYFSLFVHTDMAAASSTVVDVATKLDALSIDDAAAIIVGGEGTIQNHDMPFVNRHEELWQLFCVNAKNINKVIDFPMTIKDYRPLELLFCVQVSREYSLFSFGCVGSCFISLSLTFPSTVHIYLTVLRSGQNNARRTVSFKDNTRHGRPAVHCGQVGVRIITGV
jgi:hypothetical protein